MKTKADISILMGKVFADCQDAREAGQKEYAHDSENAFGNFERLAKELDLPREKVLWIFFKKHLDGILSHIKGHRSQREPVEGRIKDAIVYLILLQGMVEDDRDVITSVAMEPILTGYEAKVESWREQQARDMQNMNAPRVHKCTICGNVSDTAEEHSTHYQMRHTKK